MSSFQKALDKLKSNPKAFTWKALARILSHFGFEEIKKGKTGGSRVKFYHKASGTLIVVHRPHNPEILKPYQVDDVLQKLKEGKHI